MTPDYLQNYIDPKTITCFVAIRFSPDPTLFERAAKRFAHVRRLSRKKRKIETARLNRWLNEEINKSMVFE